MRCSASDTKVTGTTACPGGRRVRRPLWQTTRGTRDLACAGSAGNRAEGRRAAPGAMRAPSAPNIRTMRGCGVCPLSTEHPHGPTVRSSAAAAPSARMVHRSRLSVPHPPPPHLPHFGTLGPCPGVRAASGGSTPTVGAPPQPAEPARPPQLPWASSQDPPVPARTIAGQALHGYKGDPTAAVPGMPRSRGGRRPEKAPDPKKAPDPRRPQTRGGGPGGTLGIAPVASWPSARSGGAPPAGWAGRARRRPLVSGATGHGRVG